MSVLALFVKSAVSTSGVAALEDGRLGTGDYHDFKPLHNPQTYMGPIVIDSQFELEDGRKKCADPKNTSKLLDCMMCPADEQCCAAKYSPAHGVGCTNYDGGPRGGTNDDGGPFRLPPLEDRG